jgi:hypothetical protein
LPEVGKAMFYNRIAEYQQSNAESNRFLGSEAAFVPVPCALIPGPWAMLVYAAAFAQAQKAVEMRRPNYARSECWN